MANRIPLIVNSSTNQIAELPSADSLDLTGNTITYGSYTITLPSITGTLYAPGGALGTPASGTLTNCTFPTLNQNTTGTASNVTGTVAVANGGTGLTTTPANGAIDIGNGTGFTRTTITAGTGITVTNGGKGYIYAPFIEISGSGIGAVVKATINAVGPDHVKEVIAKHRYVGQEILASELLV